MHFLSKLADITRKSSTLFFVSQKYPLAVNHFARSDLLMLGFLT